MTPKVTVLMPVYNGARYLREAIDSILSQTFTDYEFLIIDDGSTDETDVIVRSYSDRRIRYLQNDRNRGIIFTLNRSLNESVGDYIARMDADDVSLPSRLENQMSVFCDSQIGVCGAWIKTFGVDKRIIRYPSNHEDIKATMLFENPIAHPTVMIRKSCLNTQYKIDDLHAEDYGLWSGLIDTTRFVNIPKVLLHYRVHATNITRTKRDIAAKSIENIHIRLLLKLDIKPSVREIMIHESISNQSADVLPKDWDMEEVRDWKSKLLKQIRVTGYFPEEQVKSVLNQHLYLLFNQLVRKGWGMYLRIIRSSLCSEMRLTWQQKLHLGVKSVVKSYLR